MSTYLEAIRPKLSKNDYQKLSSINNPKVHQFVAECAELCGAGRIFICSDSAQDLAYVRQQAMTTGEEQPLSILVILYTLMVKMIKVETAQRPSTLYPKEKL
jgi:GTP-dependent phosphoenolpyruvate carboxykinase